VPCPLGVLQAENIIIRRAKPIFIPGPFNQLYISMDSPCVSVNSSVVNYNSQCVSVYLKKHTCGLEEWLKW
jgi:hypothetical protein